jgi:HSP20 family molecular chaperone IbpA
MRRAPLPKPGPETVRLRSQGGFRARRTAAWRLGEWLLPPDRLVFYQADRRLFDLPLDKIVATTPEQAKFILVRKPVLRVTYADPRKAKPQDIWLIAADVSRWAEALRQAGAVAETNPERRPPAGICTELPTYEIHDEARALLVVATVPNLKRETLRAEADGRQLRLTAETARGPYDMCIALPCGVLPQPADLTIANDVLCARLTKVAWRQP